MQSVLDYPLVYNQHVAWEIWMPLVMLIMSCIIVMLKVLVWLYIEHTGILSADVRILLLHQPVQIFKTSILSRPLKLVHVLKNFRNSAFRIHYLLWTNWSETTTSIRCCCFGQKLRSLFV